MTPDHAHQIVIFVVKAHLMAGLVIVAVSALGIKANMIAMLPRGRPWLLIMVCCAAFVVVGWPFIIPRWLKFKDQVIAELDRQKK